MDKPSIITFTNVSLKFGELEAVRCLNLELSQQKIAVIGSNGSGKSSFVRLINGLLLPTTGQVTVNGYSTLTQSKAVRRMVGFVFQNPDNQIVMPVVEEDLAFGLHNLRLGADEIKRRIDAVLTHHKLGDKRHYATARLSGGQKQLVAICGVLVMRPQIIVLDEPTTQLDLVNKRKIAEVIRQLKQQIIVVTHDLDLVEDFDRVLVFNHSELIYDGRPDEAISAYKKAID